MNEEAEEGSSLQEKLTLRIKTMDSTEVKIEVDTVGQVNDLKQCILDVSCFICP